MKRKRFVAAVVPLCVLLLAGCQCEHKWVEANCTTAKICSECGETEGESLGHKWMDADCLTAKTCAECGETEGEPLGHDSGNWIISNDIVYAEEIRERSCKRCNAVLETKKDYLLSFSEDSSFIFSPKEFLDRFTKYAQLYLDYGFRYEIETGLDGKSMNVMLSFEGSDENDYLVTFCNKAGEVLTEKDLHKKGVWYVALSTIVKVDSVQECGIVLDPDLMMAFYMTCDPLFSEKDYKQQELRQYACYLNWVEHGEFAGYSEMNELYYEFSNFLYSEESADSGFFIQQIGVYPFNFMS